MRSKIFHGLLIASLMAASVAWAQLPTRPAIKPRPLIEIPDTERPVVSELEVRPFVFGDVESFSFDENAQGPMDRVAAVSRNHELLFTGQFFPDDRFEILSLPSGRAVGEIPLQNSRLGLPTGASSAVGRVLGVVDQESFLVLFNSCIVALFRWHHGEVSLVRFLPGPPPYDGLQSMNCIDIAQAADGRYYISTTEQIEGVVEPLGFVSRYDPENQAWRRQNRFGNVVLSKGEALAFDPVQDELAILAAVGDEHKLIRSDLDFGNPRTFTLPSTVKSAKELVSFAGMAAIASRQNNGWSLMLFDNQGELRDQISFERPIMALALEAKTPNFGNFGRATIWMLGSHRGAGLHRIPLSRTP